MVEIDRAVLHEIRVLGREKGPEMLSKIVGTFLAESPRLVQKIQDAIVKSYRDHGQEKWVFRCWGTSTCDGWLSLDHGSQQSAERARDRHVAEQHGEPAAPAATQATDTPKEA